MNPDASLNIPYTTYVAIELDPTSYSEKTLQVHWNLQGPLLAWARVHHVWHKLHKASGNMSLKCCLNWPIFSSGNALS